MADWAWKAVTLRTRKTKIALAFIACLNFHPTTKVEEVPSHPVCSIPQHARARQIRKRQRSTTTPSGSDSPCCRIARRGGCIGVEGRCTLYHHNHRACHLTHSHYT